MKGLLMKDVFNLKGQLKIYLILPLVSLFFAYQSGSFEYMTMMVSVVIMITPLSAFSYDEHSQFSSYALTLPLKRKDLVYSKYLLNFMMAVMAVITSIACVFVMFLIFQGRASVSIDLPSVLLEQVVSCFAVYVLSTLLLPLLFKYGSEKARLVMVISFIVIGVLGYAFFAMNFAIAGNIISFILDHMLAIGVVSGLIILISSLLCSLHIMNGKEY